MSGLAVLHSVITRPAGQSAPSALLGGRQEAIRQLIQDRWAEHGLSFRGNAPEHVISTRPARIQEKSVLFEYTVRFADPHPSLGLIAKIHRQSHPNEDHDLGLTPKAIREGRTEWEKLSSAYRHFAGRRDGLAVVRPVAYIEPYHALLVEKASGQELAKIMGTSAPYQKAALTRAGRWLSTFHELHALSNREWTLNSYTASLDVRRSKFISLAAPRGQWEALLDRVHASAGQLGSQPVPAAVLHGDFRLRHIWATPEGIEVLDLGNAHEGDCYYDVASLVVELMTVRLGRPLIGRRRVDEYIDAFLDAYFSGDTPPRVFWFYVIDRLFKKWGRWLSRWNHPSKQTSWSAAALHQCAQLIHGTSVANHLYVSPWFAARITESLGYANGRKR
jgi:streptomycin 6-kinase